MDTEILTLGDELCRGEIVDTNSSFLAERLTDLGFRVRWMTSTTDDATDVEAALAQAEARARLVVCSGGLGPTEDDRTLDVAGRLFDIEPLMDDGARAAMEARFQKTGFRMTPNNLRQVRVLAGARVLENRWGLAPGSMVSHRGVTFIFMPGVPREMRPMFEEEAVPHLFRLLERAQSAETASFTAVRHLRVFGLGESHIDHRLDGLSRSKDGVTVHYRVAFPECFVKIIVRRASAGIAESIADDLANEARQRLGAYAYGNGSTTPFPAAVGRALRQAGLTLATAESCTGGLAASLVTDVPGSSDYFLGGYVTYSNDMKRDLLAVRGETLRSHGAVSAECVTEMAEGARRRSGAKIAVAISGIAGPGGGTPDKPVGTVWFALAAEGIATRTITRRLIWGREQFKLMAAYIALDLVRRHAENAELPS